MNFSIHCSHANTKRVPAFRVATVLLVFLNIRVKLSNPPKIFSINFIVMPVIMRRGCYGQMVLSTVYLLMIIMHTQSQSRALSVWSLNPLILFFTFNSQNNISTDHNLQKHIACFSNLLIINVYIYRD